MNFVWKTALDDVDWQELAELYHRAPLGDRNPADLQTAFTNSLFRYFVYDAGKLVGAGRAFCDGAYCAFLCDIAFLPEYQGLGLGRQMVDRLVEDSAADHGKIMLYAVPAKIPFYRKLGFRKMKTTMALFFNQPEEIEQAFLEDE